jgi:hypothetical protein
VAKKAKTPRPPVQAPKRRETKSGGLGAMPRWALVVGALVAAAVVVGVVLATSGGGDDDGASGVQAAMTAAGCTYREVPPRPPKNGTDFHADVPTLGTNPRWSTDPPSAGSHWVQWAVWGFYRAPVDRRRVVHNLEHGGVVMWWGPDVPRATVDQLEAFYRESPNSMFGTPDPTLGNEIVLTAWTGPADYRAGEYGTGHIARCTEFDQAAFEAFRDAYRLNGPEELPESANEPGVGPS